MLAEVVEEVPAIDLEHRRIMDKVLDERVKLELLYDCTRE
jgi:hypothetical protein